MKPAGERLVGVAVRDEGRIKRVRAQTFFELFERFEEYPGTSQKGLHVGSDDAAAGHLLRRELKRRGRNVGGAVVTNLPDARHPVQVDVADHRPTEARPGEVR